MLDTQGLSRVCIIGFKEATITNEYLHWLSLEFSGLVEVVHPDRLVPQLDCAYIVGVTHDQRLRAQVIDQLQNFPLATFIHPTALIHKQTLISAGTFIGPFASVYYQATVNQHCIVAPYCMISHGTTLGEASILHPNVTISGSCVIGRHCVFGVRSTVIDKISICDDVFVGAGALITKHIDTAGHYMGVPARPSGRQKNVTVDMR